MCKELASVPCAHSPVSRGVLRAVVPLLECLFPSQRGDLFRLLHVFRLLFQLRYFLHMSNAKRRQQIDAEMRWPPFRLCFFRWRFAFRPSVAVPFPPAWIV